jgi:hypothetical protein
MGNTIVRALFVGAFFVLFREHIDRVAYNFRLGLTDVFAPAAVEPFSFSPHAAGHLRTRKWSTFADFSWYGKYGADLSMSKRE